MLVKELQMGCDYTLLLFLYNSGKQADHTTRAAS